MPEIKKNKNVTEIFSAFTLLLFQMKIKKTLSWENFNANFFVFWKNAVICNKLHLINKSYPNKADDNYRYYDNIVTH